MWLPFSPEKCEAKQIIKQYNPIHKKSSLPTPSTLLRQYA